MTLFCKIFLIFIKINQNYSYKKKLCFSVKKNLYLMVILISFTFLYKSYIVSKKVILASKKVLLISLPL